MKLELEGKMVPAFGGFDGCFFLPKDQALFGHPDYFPNCPFPSTFTEVSLHLQAQHCSHKTFCCQTKDNLYLLLLYCFLSSQKKPHKTKQKTEKKNQANEIVRLALLQTEKDYFPPDFWFTRMQIIPCFVLALLTAVIKARNLFFLGES